MLSFPVRLDPRLMRASILAPIAAALFGAAHLYANRYCPSSLSHYRRKLTSRMQFSTFNRFTTDAKHLVRMLRALSCPCCAAPQDRPTRCGKLSSFWRLLTEQLCIRLT